MKCKVFTGTFSQVEKECNDLLHDEDAVLESFQIHTAYAGGMMMVTLVLFYWPFVGANHARRKSAFYKNREGSGNES